MNSSTNTSIKCSIAPWLSAKNGATALDFYKAAFHATESYRMDTPDGGVVAKLSIEGAEFWLSGEPENTATKDEAHPEARIRMILTVPDPDTVFANALAAGASEVFPVGEQYGWRLGRLADPEGHHWEIGHPLE